MTLTLNDIWAQFNRLIQSNTATDIERKINAINMAQRYLIERMYQLGRRTDEFLTNPTNMSNTIDLNYITCPDNYLTLDSAWYRSGTQYIPFGKYAYITYDDLLMRIGQNFFDSDVNGAPSILAVKEPNIYFDQHFNNTFTDSETITGTTSGATGTVSSVSGTTLTYAVVSGSFSEGEVITGSTSGTTATISSVTTTTMTIAITGGTKEIKISYYKYAATIVSYDQLALTTISDTFTVGETVTGTTSAATATIYSVGDDYINLLTVGATGTWEDGETITGADSGVTALVDGSISNKITPLEWTEKYKLLLTEASGLMWMHLKGSNNVPARSDIVDGLIEMLSTLNRGEEETVWSTDN